MTAADFLAAFPQTERDFTTGGGCTAWRVPLAEGWYALLTDGDAQQPDEQARRVFVGVYDECDGAVDFEDSDLINWGTAIALVRDWNRPEFR